MSDQNGDAPSPSSPPNPVLRIVIHEHVMTRQLQVDFGGLPDEIAFEILARATEFVRRRRIVADLREELTAKPEIIRQMPAVLDVDARHPRFG